MSDPTILALDLATRTGFAFGALSDRSPVSGSVAFGKTGASMGAVFCNARQWLADFTLVHKPDIIVFEAPLAPSFKRGATNVATIRLLMGLAAVVELFCYPDIDCREAKVAEVRRHFIGTHVARRVAAKAMTIAACRRLGWNPIDDNAADALALLHYQASILNPKLSIETSPLFRRG